MEQLNRWVAKHYWILLACCSFFGSFAVSRVPDDQDWSLAVMILVSAPVICLILWIAGRRTHLLQKALKVMKEQCDPYPFLSVVQEQLTYWASAPVKQMMQVNYALALRLVGEYEKACELMESINIDKHAMAPQVKAIYYNNRMDICALMGKYQEANIWYGKTVQIWQDLKPSKEKERLGRAVAENRALYHFCNGEFDLALQVLGQAKPQNLSERIENAMMYGRTYLAMGERSRAVKPLRFVAENGNKLYFATEAKELLEKINMEEQ